MKVSIEQMKVVARIHLANYRATRRASYLNKAIAATRAALRLRREKASA